MTEVAKELDTLLVSFGQAYAMALDGNLRFATKPKARTFVKQEERLLEELTTAISKLLEKQVNDFADNYIGQVLAKSNLPNGWVYKARDKFLEDNSLSQSPVEGSE